jgi:hypothetical protein
VVSFTPRPLYPWRTTGHHTRNKGPVRIRIGTEIRVAMPGQEEMSVKQENTEVAINANQEKMEVAIDAMCPKSEETINKWVECILVSADQQTQSLRFKRYDWMYK